MASLAGLNPEEVANASALYITKCAKCHQFYNPNDYTPAEWDKWMRRMSRKAKLQPNEQELLTRYLAAFRQPPAVNTNRP
jgi:hypothetical protein